MLCALSLIRVMLSLSFMCFIFDIIDEASFRTNPNHKCIKHTNWNDMWNDGGAVDPIIYQNTGSNRTTFTSSSDQCLYICNSYFYDMSGNTNGGCIYVSTKSSTTKLLVETSTFYNSSVLSKGAVIYMQEGNSILSKLCGVECKTEQNSGAFSRIDVTNHETSINRVLDSTITRCSSVDNGYPLCNYYGEIIMKSVNVSKNKCSVCSAFLCWGTENEKSSSIASISFTSITNNTAETYLCVSFRDTGPYIMNYTNIIFNIQQNDSIYGLIAGNGKTTLIHITILGNQGNPIFQSSRGDFEIINSTISDDQFQSTGSKLITSNLTPFSFFVNSMSFLSTGSCNNIYDRFASLTPRLPLKFVEKTSHKTIIYLLSIPFFTNKQN